METNKERNWKRQNKVSVCTKAPWELLIPYKDRANIMLAIKQETIDAYGYDMLECPKRKVCMSKSCMGRPLPWKSKTAKPYLDKLKDSFKFKYNELYIETDCSKCPISNKCSSTCSQVYDYIERHKSEDQVNFNFTHELDKNPIVKSEVSTSEIDFKKEYKQIPWDCLNKRKQKVVLMYLYEQRDYLHIARKLGLYNQAAARYEFYSALTKLSKFAMFREFIKKEHKTLSKLQLKIIKKAFINNKSYVKVAKDMKVSPQAVQQIISRITKAYNIKWNVFVRKENGKLIYNVPGIMK